MGRNVKVFGIYLIALAMLTFTACSGGSTDNGTQAQKSDKVFKLALVYEQPGTVGFEVAQKFVEDLKIASDGRLDVALHGVGAIVPPTKEYNGVNEGAIDMAHIPCAWAKEKVPTASLFSGAVGGLSDLGMGAWLAEGGLDMMREVYAKGYPNVYVLDSTRILGEVWGYSKKKLETIDDIKGLRMRCMGDAGAIFNNLGASVVFMPGGEIYESLRRGVLDWAEWATIKAGYDFGFQEICPYMYFSTLRAPTNYLAFIINKKTWESLPPDLQLLLDTFVDALEAQRNDTIVKEEIATLQKIVDYGVEVLPVPVEIDAALLKGAREYYKAEAAKDPMFKKIYNSQLSFSKKYNEFDSLMLATDWAK